MTNQQIAQRIADFFAALDFPVRTEVVNDGLDSVQVLVGTAPERRAFLVSSTEVASVQVETLNGHLRPRNFTRDGKSPKRWADVKDHCELIVEVVRRDDERRAKIGMAREVTDDLRALGLPAVVVSGRVAITLDFSPEHAREMGPKIAALLGERKAAT